MHETRRRRRRRSMGAAAVAGDADVDGRTVSVCDALLTTATATCPSQRTPSPPTNIAKVCFFIGAHRVRRIHHFIKYLMKKEAKNV